MRIPHLRLQMSRARTAAVATLAMVAALFVGTVGASPAFAVGTYDNATIADTALQYVGQWGGEACRAAGKLDSGNTGTTVGGYGAGQCKTFVNCVVWLASSGSQYPTGGYSSGFQGAGGTEVTGANAVNGDIIQVGESNAANPLHTAIVVQNLGGGSYNVVDSNFGSPSNNEMVHRHNWSPGSTARFWRMGTYVSTPAPPAAPASGVNLSGAVYMGGDHLGIGQSMATNRYLTSSDGRYVLYLKSDGNLVEYGPGLVPLWWSGTAGLGGAYVVMQSDGNFVMYKSDGVTPVWATWTDGRSGSYLTVQPDGNLVMYQSDGATGVWASGRTGDMFTATSTGSDHINANQPQYANTYLQSADGRYRLLLIGDGNWVLYGPGYHVLWANWANGTNGAYIVLQSDGNLVEYKADHATVAWAVYTGGLGGAYVVVQNDGNVIMYQSNGVTAVWGTSTAGQI